MNHLQEVIEKAWETRNEWDMRSATAEVRDAVEHTIQLLDDGGVRVAERNSDGIWVTNEWLKKAVLLFFKLHDNQLIHGGDANYFDKVPMKFSNWGEQMFRKAGMRVVPPATVRKGAFIGEKVVLMPSYVNIGAYVDEGTMVDTWATVGSCARSVKMFTSPAALALVAYLSHYRPHQPSSKTTALSAPAPKWWKASLFVKVLCYQWVFISANQHVFMIVRLVRLLMAKYHHIQWWSPAPCQAKRAARISTVL